MGHRHDLVQVDIKYVPRIGDIALHERADLAEVLELLLGSILTRVHEIVAFLVGTEGGGIDK